jgi:hypothetical protein
MKQLKWREPWALTRRRGWRTLRRLFVQSSLPLICVTLPLVIFGAGWYACHVISPAYDFPYRTMIFAALAFPVWVLLVLLLFMIAPQHVVLGPKQLGFFADDKRSAIKPLQLLAWCVQERRGYRRLVVRFVNTMGCMQRRVHWLPASVDRADLEHRMHDFAARGEAQRSRRGEQARCSQEPRAEARR